MNLGAVWTGVSSSGELSEVGLPVAGCGVSEGGTIMSPSGPDFGNLVLFLFSFSEAFQIAAWVAVGTLKYRLGRPRAASRRFARTQNSLRAHAGVEMLAKVAVKPIASSSLMAARLPTSFAAARIHVMILMSVIMVLSRVDCELMIAPGVVWVVRGVRCDSDRFLSVCWGCWGRV